MLPVVVFLISCVLSFSTGTSWGTFAIMIPLTMPIAIGLGDSMGLTGAALVKASLVPVGAILGGAIFGEAARRSGHAHHVAEGRQNHVRDAGQCNRAIQIHRRCHADRAARPGAHLHLAFEHLPQPEAENSVRVPPAKLHQPHGLGRGLPDLGDKLAG